MENWEAYTVVESIRKRLDIIGAIILRDMRTRFGRSHLGYILAVLWPLTHLVGITIIFTVLRRSAPIFGTDNAVFLATGALPYILVMYPSRMTSFAIDMNKPLFIFPIVSPLDLITARVVVEFLTAFSVIIIFSAGCLMFGVNIIPRDVTIASMAIFSTVYLSVCFGLLSTILVALTDFWKTASAIVMVFAYISSGIFAPMETLSPNIQAILSYNPLTHCVEWLRSAYFIGYGDSFVSRPYVFWTATVMLFLSLLGERFLRGRLMKQ